jgi:hypothetical protein
MEKYPIDPARIRHLPARFSWLDQRLVTDRRLQSCPRSSQALYLFLAVVSDARGLSYYSDKSIRAHLAMPRDELLAARRTLIEQQLLLFEAPLYQLLSLDPLKADSRQRTGRTLSLKDLIGLPEEIEEP